MNENLDDGTIVTRYVQGYASLSAFIASDKDKSTAIYRRFDQLSARNLLYLQSELIDLQSQQEQLDIEDWNFQKSTAERAINRDWTVLRARAREVGNERERKRLHLIKEIREKLKEYSE
jgi:hypothetical protein